MSDDVKPDHTHGIARRRRRDGTIGYQARPILAGVRHPARTFDKLSDAKRWKAQQEADLAQALAPTTNETCDRFAERWPDDYPIVKAGPTRGRRKASNTIAVYRMQLRPFVAEFRGRPLGGLSRTEVRPFANRWPKAAVAARNMFADALADGLVGSNPFAGLQLEQSRGRKDIRVISADELHHLADSALAVFGPEYGQVMRSMILFSAFTGVRAFELRGLDRRDVRFKEGELRVPVAKFDKPRTVMLLDEAADAVRQMPGRACDHLFWTPRGKRLGKGSHHYLWGRVRDRAGMPDFTWHELRHWCAHHFYVTLGYSDELTAFQLGHEDAKLVRDLYGHGQQDALLRLKRGQGNVATFVPHASAPVRETPANGGVA